jgi:hypothetical protein
MRKSTSSRKTFGFTSCGDILAKLERELARLDTAKTLEEAADHATNAAITAWHLSEWAWAALRKGGVIGKGFGWANKGEFQNWVTTEGCTELQHCEMLANSFKHLGHDPCANDYDYDYDYDSDLTPQPGPAIVEWTNSRGEKVSRANLMGEPVYFTSGHGLKWWVTEGDKKYLASELFVKVVEFWRGFLDRYAIG